MEHSNQKLQFLRIARFSQEQNSKKYVFAYRLFLF